MLVEIAIGDAYGAGFEFKNSMLVNNKLDIYHRHPTHMASDGSGDSLMPGQYTDDTQMSIAVAEVLLGDDWSKETFANSFVNCFKRDPRKGYASGFYHFLIATGSGDEFIKNIRPNSEKNGAAMRSVPLGYIRDIKVLKDVATSQASLTHDTPHGINSSILVALAAHYFIYDIGDINTLTEWLDDKVPGYPLPKTWNKSVPCHGISTFLASLTILRETNSLSQTIIKAVAFGGDTDSTASISAGIQSCNQKTLFDLPQYFYDNLENTNYGLDYLRDLDSKLKNKFVKE